MRRKGDMKKRFRRCSQRFKRDTILNQFPILINSHFLAGPRSA